ncbi:MAG: polysulfide reductase NrfD [Proteobacteria bacterium]|nr:polysulfide reductase NrfD [Pseudomonadota bacterium]
MNEIKEWVSENIFLGLEVKEYLRRLITPFNIVAAGILIIGIPLIIIRYMQGLGAVIHGSNDQPFSLFLGWGLFCGVPLAATGYIMASAVYLFGMKDYKPLLRPAVLTGFVGYFFAVMFLLVDLGRPWRLPYPMVRSFGTASILFLIAWHVALYLTVQFVEFSPAVFEWINTRKLRKWAEGIAVGATIFGVILSTLHQSALGALYLLAPTKLHPLWYSPYIPTYFFISSIYAGLSMIIIESTLVYKFLPGRVDPQNFKVIDRLTLGLGKAASFVMITYFFLKIIGVAHGADWHLLFTRPYGYQFLIEVFGFVLLPCFMYVFGVRTGDVKLIRMAAFAAVAGVILNRLTISMFALNWELPHREFIAPKEFLVILTIITIEILIYRWVVNRLPVHREHPEFTHEDE